MNSVEPISALTMGELAKLLEGKRIGQGELEEALRNDRGLDMIVRSIEDARALTICDPEPVFKINYGISSEDRLRQAGYEWSVIEHQDEQMPEEPLLSSGRGIQEMVPYPVILQRFRIPQAIDILRRDGFRFGDLLETLAYCEQEEAKAEDRKQLFNQAMALNTAWVSKTGVRFSPMISRGFVGLSDKVIRPMKWQNYYNGLYLAIAFKEA